MANCCNCENSNCGCGCGGWYPPVPGPMGPMGPIGPQGPQGVPGGVLGYADFYALMPPDNAAAVAAGTDVEFPRTGSISGDGISRVSASTFNLAEPGTYLVMYQLSTVCGAQSVLALNGAELPSTVVGRVTGASELAATSLVTTTVPNSTLSVRNPAGETSAITLTPNAGGTNPVSAHLVIVRIA